MAAEWDCPPAGHVPLVEITGLSAEELVFLQECRITHGMPLSGDCAGMFEVSRFKISDLSDPKWILFRGKGNDVSGWENA